MRGFVETCRLVPVIVTFAIGVSVLFALQFLIVEFGYLWAALGSGVVLLIAGAVAGAIAVIAKWLVVGRIRAVEHPLWSAFVWRNEVSDTFVETVAGAVVRPGRHRHAGDEPVAAGAGRQDRPGRLVRVVLATRGRPRHAGEGRHRQPGLRRADAPVPRPRDADGYRCARRGFDVRAALRGAARGSPGCGRDRRARVVGDARGRGSAVDPLAGQPDRAVECVPQEARRRRRGPAEETAA